jgi:hypothetical protein
VVNERLTVTLGAADRGLLLLETLVSMGVSLVEARVLLRANRLAMGVASLTVGIALTEAERLIG